MNEFLFGGNRTEDGGDEWGFISINTRHGFNCFVAEAIFPMAIIIAKMTTMREIWMIVESTDDISLLFTHVTQALNSIMQW